MSIIKTNTLSNVAGDKTIPVDRVAQGVAAAWVNFNGTGTVAIRAAFNVSSITDNGVGDYTANFTNALVDANYSVSGSGKNSASPTVALPVFGIISAAGTVLATSVRVGYRDINATYVDAETLCVNIFR